jgi:cyclophilin family peptidyl-prolyl cis-trans isomerase/protein-disulfide isomerase
MSKKLFALLVIGVLMLSACKAQTTPTPAETAAEETTEAADPPIEETVELTIGESAEETEATEEAEDSEPAEPISPVEGEAMPCSTVYDYELSVEAEQYQAVADQLPPVSEDDWVKGPEDAPITIIEYADFQCPACGNFSMYANALMDAFPNSIRVVFRHMPLPSIHDKAYVSSMAAEAAGAQGKFWEMHNLLYQSQQTWGYASADEFKDWSVTAAEELELDIDQFEEDLNDEAVLAAMKAETEENLNLGIHYTPFVIINDRIFRDNKPDIFNLVGIYEFGGYEDCPPWVIDPDKSYQAVIDTSAGEITINLYPKEAPLAVNSFVFLAQNDWYDDVYFHRVIEGFVAQAGDPSGFGVIGPGYSFVNETANDLTYDEAGYLGMANSGPDTNGSQFFITLAEAPNLNGSYTIFGKVTADSLPALEKITLRDPQTAVDFEDSTIINDIEIIEK